MLSGRRTVRITQNTFLFRAANQDSLPLAKIETGAVGKLMSCPENIDLCKVDFESFQGWVFKKTLWGVYKNEVFE